MTDRRLKQVFKGLYQPPDPREREQFLRQIEPTQASVWEMLRTQMSYIRPWGWLLSVAVFLAALLLLRERRSEDLWMVSALLPFAALSTILELNRSACYAMEELELATRFSLKTVLLARMGVLGLGNLLLLVALSPLVLGLAQTSVMETGFALLCPYCLTSFLCLEVLRRWRQREYRLLCAGVAGSVSIFCWVLGEGTSLLQEHGTVLWYGSITLLLLGWMLWAYRRYFIDLEEGAWN